MIFHSPHPNLWSVQIFVIKPFFFTLHSEACTVWKMCTFSFLFVLCGYNPTWKRPNLLSCGIEQLVYGTDSFPHTNAYHCSNKAQEILTDRCVLDFVTVPQGQIFSWLQEFTHLWWQCGVFHRAQSFGRLNWCTLVCQNDGRENMLYIFFSFLLLTGFSLRMFPMNESSLLGTYSLIEYVTTTEECNRCWR